MYFLVAAGRAFQIQSAMLPPRTAKGMINIGHHCQLRAKPKSGTVWAAPVAVGIKKPMQRDCKLLPRYAKASTIPEQVAVALRPPKSVAAVPDISEVMPMEAIKINTADQPTI